MADDRASGRMRGRVSGWVMSGGPCSSSDPSSSPSCCLGLLLQAFLKFFHDLLIRPVQLLVLAPVTFRCTCPGAKLAHASPWRKRESRGWFRRPGSFPWRGICPRTPIAGLRRLQPRSRNQCLSRRVHSSCTAAAQIHVHLAHSHLRPLVAAQTFSCF